MANITSGQEMRMSNNGKNIYKGKGLAIHTKYTLKMNKASLTNEALFIC